MSFDRRQTVPLALTCLRIFLAPVMVGLALYRPIPWGFGLCLMAAFLSDVFDGVIARRLAVATPSLRRLDSVADTIFYAAAVFSLWHLRPELLSRYQWPLAILIILEVARYVIDFARFHREASYHMWSSKFWGLLLFVAFFSVLVFGRGEVLLLLAIWTGVVADGEGIAISFLLSEWKNDVPTVFHALRISRLEEELAAVDRNRPSTS